jgi:hypothetical protein
VGIPSGEIPVSHREGEFQELIQPERVVSRQAVDPFQSVGDSVDMHKQASGGFRLGEIIVDQGLKRFQQLRMLF